MNHRMSFEEFAKRVFGVKVQPWQIDVLKSMDSKRARCTCCKCSLKILIPQDEYDAAFVIKGAYWTRRRLLPVPMDLIWMMGSYK